MEDKKTKVTTIEWPKALYDRIEATAKAQKKPLTFSKCVRLLCETALILTAPTEEEIDQIVTHAVKEVFKNGKPQK